MTKSRAFCEIFSAKFFLLSSLRNFLKAVPIIGVETMGISRSIMTSRVMGLFLLALLGSSCLGQGEDQLHGMFDLGFPSTAVCNAQVKTISFRNVSDSEIVIEGAAISGGTDPLGNFSLISIVIGAEEIPSINGVFQDVHVPSGSFYSFKISYVPKTEQTDHQAILDIAYKEPREGIVQVVLAGSSASRSNNCPSGDPGGPVDLDEEQAMNVELMIAATSPIEAPIDTNQGQQPFNPVDLTVILDKAAGMVRLPAFTEDTFVLPPPRLDVPGIGGIIRGPTLITITADAEGTYDSATGSLEISNVQIHMEGELDFSANLEITLTTGRQAVSSVSPPVNRNALKQFGSPLHWDSTTNEIFGSPIDSSTRQVVLVGLTKMKDVVLKDGSDPRLQPMKNATMAVLIQGTLRPIVSE